MLKIVNKEELQCKKCGSKEFLEFIVSNYLDGGILFHFVCSCGLSSGLKINLKDWKGRTEENVI